MECTDCSVCHWCVRCIKKQHVRLMHMVWEQDAVDGVDPREWNTFKSSSICDRCISDERFVVQSCGDECFTIVRSPYAIVPEIGWTEKHYNK